MNQTGKCPIWGNECIIRHKERRNVITSERAGGGYLTPMDSAGVLQILVDGLSDREKAVLTTWIISQQRLGTTPTLTRNILEQVKSGRLRRMNPFDRADKLLHIMVREFEPGRTEAIHSLIERDNVLAETESISPHDVTLLIDFLWQRGLVSGYEDHRKGAVTLHGYQRIAELERPNVESRQVFVAMWFDDRTSNLRESIRQAIGDAEFEPFIIDEARFANKICDRIEAEIRRSRLVVADFTHGDRGARGSVYYEAGLAVGLGLPVIWTCHTSQLGDLHFDTRQYPHVPWDDDALTDFQERLSDRLRLLLSN